MKKIFRILIVSLVIIFVTNNVFAVADTNVTKESHVWIKNNSDYPLNLFVERIETLIPDSSVNYFVGVLVIPHLLVFQLMWLLYLLVEWIKLILLEIM